MTVAQETVDPKNELFPRLEETPKTVVIEVIGVRVATNLASLESDFNSINVLIIARMQDFVDSRLDGYHLKIYTEFAKDNPIPLSIRGIKPELRWLSYHEGEVNYLIDPSFEREPYDTKFRENPQIQPREFSNCIKTEFKTWEEATPLLNDSLVFLIWKDGYGVALNDPPQN
ncbi:MAG: hypothetical protein KDC26_03975 [Armatimonadetes bacterium]|nr:hypothetical protein [Armatimonadota bacterium]